MVRRGRAQAPGGRSVLAGVLVCSGATGTACPVKPSVIHILHRRPCNRKADSTCQHAEEVRNGHVLSGVVDLLCVTLSALLPACAGAGHGVPAPRPCLDVVQEQVARAERAPKHGAWEGVARVAGPVVCQHEDNTAIWDSQPGRKGTRASVEAKLNTLGQRDSSWSEVAGSLPSDLCVDRQGVGGVSVVVPEARGTDNHCKNRCCLCCSSCVQQACSCTSKA